jgi:hypothetical protein
VLASVALAIAAVLVTRPTPEEPTSDVHQVANVEVPPSAASQEATALPATLPAEQPRALAETVKGPETSPRTRLGSKKELGVVLFSCPVGSRVFDKGVLVDTLTERNRTRFTLPLGPHAISVRTPDGRTTRTRTLTVSREYSDQFDCE